MQLSTCVGVNGCGSEHTGTCESKSRCGAQSTHTQDRGSEHTCASVRLCSCVVCLCESNFWGSQYVRGSLDLSTRVPLLIWGQMARDFLDLNICAPVKVDMRELAGRSIIVCVPLV